MTNKLKKLARKLSKKAGMSYQAAVNALFTARDAKTVRVLLETDLPGDELHDHLLGLMVPSILKAYETGAKLPAPVVVFFADDEVERMTGEKEEVTLNGKTFLANVVESGPSQAEQRIVAADGILVARSESQGHVMGVAVVPRAPWLEVLRETYGHDDLPVTPGKITISIVSILATDTTPTMRQYSRRQLADLAANLRRAVKPTAAAN